MKQITFVIATAGGNRDLFAATSTTAALAVYPGGKIVGIETRVCDARCIHGGVSSPFHTEAPLTPKPAPTKKGTLI